MSESIQRLRARVRFHEETLRAFQARRPNDSFEPALGHMVALFSDLHWYQFDSLSDTGVVDALCDQCERDDSYIVAIYSLLPQYLMGFRVSSKDDAPR